MGTTLKEHLNKAAHAYPNNHVSLKADHGNKKNNLILYYIVWMIDIYYII